MWAKRVATSTTVRAKQFHACDKSEMLTKTEMVLVQASMHVNDTSIQRNQENNTHTSENTKNDRNAAKDKLRPLTRESLSWMCRRVLDVLWDVKAPRSM